MFKTRKPKIKVTKFEKNELVTTDERIDKTLLDGLNFAEIKDWIKIIFKNSHNPVKTPMIVHTPKMISHLKTIRRKSFLNESSKTNHK